MPAIPESPYAEAILKAGGFPVKSLHVLASSERYSTEGPRPVKGIYVLPPRDGILVALIEEPRGDRFQVMLGHGDTWSLLANDKEI